MTEFEEQVATALVDGFQEAIRQGVGDANYSPGYYFVARRVAAAFLETVDGNDVQAQADFVAALKAVAP